MRGKTSTFSDFNGQTILTIMRKNCVLNYLNRLLLFKRSLAILLKRLNLRHFANFSKVCLILSTSTFHSKYCILCLENLYIKASLFCICAAFNDLRKGAPPALFPSIL